MLVIATSVAVAASAQDRPSPAFLQRSESQIALQNGMDQAERLLNQGDEDSAIEIYRQLHAKFPSGHALWFKLANLLLDAGDRSSAIDYFILAEPERSNPAGLDSFITFGRVAMKLNRNEDAMQIFSAGSKLVSGVQNMGFSSMTMVNGRPTFSTRPPPFQQRGEFATEGEATTPQRMCGELLTENGDQMSNLSMAESGLLYIPKSAYANYVVAKLSTNNNEKKRYLDLAKKYLTPTEGSLGVTVDGDLKLLATIGKTYSESLTHILRILKAIDKSRKIPSELTMTEQCFGMGRSVNATVSQYKRGSSIYWEFYSSEDRKTVTQQTWVTPQSIVTLHGHTYQISAPESAEALKRDDFYWQGAGIGNLTNLSLEVQHEVLQVTGTDSDTGDLVTATLSPNLGYLASNIMVSSNDKRKSSLFTYSINFSQSPPDNSPTLSSVNVSDGSGNMNQFQIKSMNFAPPAPSLFKFELVKPGYTVIDGRFKPPVVWTYAQLDKLGAKGKPVNPELLSSLAPVGPKPLLVKRTPIESQAPTDWTKLSAILLVPFAIGAFFLKKKRGNFGS